MKLSRNKNFYLLWTSQISSQLAINIMNFLVLIQIYERTHSSIASSLVWVAYGVPAVILGPIAAAAVDMSNKRKLLITANLVQAVVIFVYALLYSKFLYLSYGVVFLYSVMDQFYVPAEAASLPSLINKNNLTRANGLFFISAQTMALVGFGTAGLISELVGFRAAVVVGGTMLLVAFGATLNLPRIGVSKIKTGAKMDELVIEFFERIREGYLFIRSQKTIYLPFIFLIWLQVSLSMLVVNLPAIGKDIIGTKPSLAGTIVIFPAAIGALLGTFMLPKIFANNIRKKRVVETALVLLALNFIFVAVIAPFLSFWTNRLTLVVAFFVLGAAYVSALVPTLTFLQLQTPHKLMGRVFGNFWFVANTATLIPVVFSATISEIFGVNLVIMFIGLIALGIFVFSRVKAEKYLLTA